MWLQLLFSTADIVSWISTEMGSDLELTTLWCQCHILMPFCHTLCVCQEFNFQMYMRTHKLLTFSRPHLEFISKRTEISSTFPIQFYLTLVSQIEMSPSNWLFEFSLQTNERARHHQRTAPLTCHRHTEQKMWWAILWGGFCLWMGSRESWKTTSHQVFPILPHDIYPGHTTPPLFSTWCPKMHHTWGYLSRQPAPNPCLCITSQSVHPWSCSWPAFLTLF